MTRRTVLRGVGLAGAAIGLAGSATPASAQPRRPLPWAWFARGVAHGFSGMNMVGAAVALIPRWTTAQNKLATALGAEHVTKTDSPHLIALANPEVVSAAIRSTLEHVDR